VKKGKVFFHPIEDSGPLTISWSSVPKGDAVEAKKGAGVGFFSEKGDLLCKTSCLSKRRPKRKQPI